MKDFIKVDFELLNESEFHLFLDLADDLLFPRYTAKDFDDRITHRKINGWFNENLLMVQREKGKWRKFNFIEYCWVQIIDDLRKFEIGFNEIRKIKEKLLHQMDWQSLFDVPEYVEEVLKFIPVNEREEARRLMLEKKLMDEGGGGLESSLLFITVLDCLIKKEQLSIFINHEGEVWPVKLNKLPVLWGFEEFRKFMQGHYICISLTSVISSFIKEYVVKKENFQLQILTEKENEVLKLIRSKNLKSLNVKFDAKSNIELIESTKVQEVDTAARLVDLIMSNGYQTITLKTDKGKVVYCENTRKQKLKDLK